MTVHIQDVTFAAALPKSRATSSKTESATLLPTEPSAFPDVADGVQA